MDLLFICLVTYNPNEVKQLDWQSRRDPNGTVYVLAHSSHFPWIERRCVGTKVQNRPFIFPQGQGHRVAPFSLRISNLHRAVSPHLHLSAGPRLLCPATHPVMNYTAHSGSFCMNHCYCTPTWHWTWGGCSRANFAGSFSNCHKQRSFITVSVILHCSSRIYHHVQVGGVMICWDDVNSHEQCAFLHDSWVNVMMCWFVMWLKFLDSCRDIIFFCEIQLRN